MNDDFDFWIRQANRIPDRSGPKPDFLASSAPFGQPVTWAGSLFLLEAPQPGDTLEIVREASRW